MLRTIGDAGEYILALPQKRGRLAHWEQVRRLLMKETSGAVVSHTVHLALSKDDSLMSSRLRASPALGDGGAHTRSRRAESEVDTA